MNALTNRVSRRSALRGVGGAGLATALGVGLSGRLSADSGHPSATTVVRATSSDDPAAVIEAYITAVNAADLEAILALYADDAVHIFLPTPDGSAGVCLGKAQFTMWYEQSLANGDRVELEGGTLAVDRNQATFLSQISSEPWRQLGLGSLAAKSNLVLIDGRIMTHLVTPTPDAVRQLQAARGSASDLTTSSAAPLLPSERRGFGKPH